MQNAIWKVQIELVVGLCFIPHTNLTPTHTNATPLPHSAKTIRICSDIDVSHKSIVALLYFRLAPKQPNKHHHPVFPFKCCSAFSLRNFTNNCN